MKKKESATPFLIIVLLLFVFSAVSLWQKIQQLEKEEKIRQGQVASQTTTSSSAPASLTIKKKKKPEIKFFVISFCPFANQAEASLKPVAELFKDKVSWQPVYIVSDAQQACQKKCRQKVYNKNSCQQLVDRGQITDLQTCRDYLPYDSEESCWQKECSTITQGKFVSLHGEQELKQNIREICAWNISQQKWWDFVTRVNNQCQLTNIDSCWQTQAEKAQLSVEKIKNCQQNETDRLLNQQLSLVNKHGIKASPIVLINNHLYEGNRQPEDYKRAICAAFESQPEECQAVLSSINKNSSQGSCY